MAKIVTLEDVSKAMAGPAPAVIVDTLPPEAFAKGHLPGAITIRSDDILAQAPQRLADRDAEIVVYCASPRCMRAGKSAARLESLGYRRVRHFEGGKEAWREAGLPLVTG